MTRRHGPLVLAAVAALILAGGLMTLTGSPQPAAKAQASFLAPSPDNAVQRAAGSGNVQQVFSQEDSDKVLPGCCTTQCTVNKDCDKICGKGNCACVQESSCCRRCVY